MAKKIKRPFCTIFKRTEAEKRAWRMGKELDAQKEELEMLKARLEELERSSSKA